MFLNVPETNPSNLGAINQWLGGSTGGGTDDGVDFYDWGGGGGGGDEAVIDDSPIMA